MHPGAQRDQTRISAKHIHKGKRRFAVRKDLARVGRMWVGFVFSCVDSVTLNPTEGTRSFFVCVLF